MFFILKVIKGWRTKRSKEAYEKFKVESLLKLDEEEGVQVDDELFVESLQSAKNKKFPWTRLRDWITKNIPQWLVDARNNQNWTHFRKKLKTYGTIENFYAKSIVGFLCGILVMYVTFLFFAFPLAMPLTKATVLSIILGVPAMVLLAFNEAARCVVLMLIPHLFSSKGRQALAAYAIILSFSEPGRNAVHNIRVLSDSLACGQVKLKLRTKTSEKMAEIKRDVSKQEKANQLLKSVVALVKEPFVQIKNTMSDVMTRIKQVLKKMKGSVDTIKRVMSSIIDVIQTAFDWLNNVVGLCSKKLGTPFQRCTRAFDNAIDDCNAKLGSWFNWMCSVAYVTKTVCFVVKFIDYICAMFEFVSDEIVVKARRRLKEFVYHVRNLFYVSIDFSHESSYEMAKSQDVSDVLLSIAKDFKRMFAELFGWLDGASVIFSLFMFYCIYSAYRYRKKFLSREWYDNHFLTRHLIEIEVRRTQMDKETIFPLSRWEKSKYVQLTSLKLIGTEKIKMITLIILMAWLFAKIGLIISTDFSIWWLVLGLDIKLNIEALGLSPIEVNVSDTGVMSDVYKGVVDSFQPKGLNTDIDTSNCVPAPENPTYFAYKQLAILVIFIFIMTIFEPYGQRLRVIIMNYYYPGVARRRAVWLYNNIIRSRGSFLKYARRQLRRKFAHDTDIETVSIQDRIFAVLPFLRMLFPRRKFEACLVCGSPPEPSEPLMRCQTPNCVGLYCGSCFNTLQNVCTICKSPIDYGDMTDLSEERDSSDYYDNLEKEIFKTNDEKVLGSDVNVSEGYETDYDHSYQNEKRDPSDVPITHNDVDSMESQRFSTDLVDEDIFELKEDQKLKDAQFRKSIEMTLKNRLDSNILENVLPIPLVSTLSPPPVKSPRSSKTSRLQSSRHVSFPKTPKRSRVVSISETDRSSSKADRTSVSYATVASEETKPKCFLIDMFCKKTMSTKKKSKTVSSKKEGIISHLSDSFTESKASSSVKNQPAEFTRASTHRVKTPELHRKATHTPIQLKHPDIPRVKSSPRLKSRAVKPERTTLGPVNNPNSNVPRDELNTKFKLPDLTRSLMKLVPAKRNRKRTTKSNRVAAVKYKRIPLRDDSYSSTSSSSTTGSSYSSSSEDSGSYRSSSSSGSSDSSTASTTAKDSRKR